MPGSGDRFRNGLSVRLRTGPPALMRGPWSGAIWPFGAEQPQEEHGISLSAASRAASRQATNSVSGSGKESDEGTSATYQTGGLHIGDHTAASASLGDARLRSPIFTVIDGLSSVMAAPIARNRAAAMIGKSLKGHFWSSGLRARHRALGAFLTRGGPGHCDHSHTQITIATPASYGRVSSRPATGGVIPLAFCSPRAAGRLTGICPASGR